MSDVCMLCANLCTLCVYSVFVTDCLYVGDLMRKFEKESMEIIHMNTCSRQIEVMYWSSKAMLY